MACDSRFRGIVAPFHGVDPILVPFRATSEEVRAPSTRVGVEAVSGGEEASELGPSNPILPLAQITGRPPITGEPRDLPTRRRPPGSLRIPPISRAVIRAP